MKLFRKICCVSCLQDRRSSIRAITIRMGFDGLDAGPLSESWRYQPGTPAYCPDPTLKELPSLLERATAKKQQIIEIRLRRLWRNFPRTSHIKRLVHDICSRF
jgi:hypothetical protein